MKKDPLKKKSPKPRRNESQSLAPHSPEALSRSMSNGLMHYTRSFSADWFKNTGIIRRIQNYQKLSQAKRDFNKANSLWEAIVALKKNTTKYLGEKLEAYLSRNPAILLYLMNDAQEHPTAPSEKEKIHSGKLIMEVIAYGQKLAPKKPGAKTSLKSGAKVALFLLTTDDTHLLNLDTIQPGLDYLKKHSKPSKKEKGKEVKFCHLRNFYLDLINRISNQSDHTLTLQTLSKNGSHPMLNWSGEKTLALNLDNSKALNGLKNNHKKPALPGKHLVTNLKLDNASCIKEKIEFETASIAQGPQINNITLAASSMRNLSATYMSITHCHWVSLDLSAATLSHMKIFSDCVFENVIFRRAQLDYLKTFSDSITFNNVSLRKASLCHAEFYPGTQFIATNFFGADLTDAILYETQIDPSCDFRNTLLLGCQMEQKTLEALKTTALSRYKQEILTFPSIRAFMTFFAKLNAYPERNLFLYETNPARGDACEIKDPLKPESYYYAELCKFLLEHMFAFIQAAEDPILMGDDDYAQLESTENIQVDIINASRHAYVEDEQQYDEFKNGRFEALCTAGKIRREGEEQTPRLFSPG